MNQPDSIRGYYKLHSRIYDATRWSFLFGRGELIQRIAALRPASVCEIGCGTGRNLALLREALPSARLTGYDISPDMIAIARKKLGASADLRLEPFTAAPGQEMFDVVFASYCLSMVNPGFETLIEAAARRVNPGGRIAVVDFAGSSSSAFRRWMGVNHVRMENHLIPALKNACVTEIHMEHKAYAGLWTWALFLGTVKRR